MKRILKTLPFLAVTLLVSGARAAFDYSVSFDSGIYDPNFSLVAYTNWQPITVGTDLGAVGTNGQFKFYKNLGIRNGAIYSFSTFFVTGDFELTVAADRTDLATGKAGLVGSFAPVSAGAWFDCYFAWMSQITAVLVFPGVTVPPTHVVNNSAVHATLRCRRVGTTLFAEYNYGAGYVGICTNSNPAFVRPARVGLFLLQDNDHTEANYAVFDNLSVHADGVLCPLSIQQSAGNAVLKWPDDGNMSVLEATTVLSPVPTWAPVTNTTSVNGWYSTLPLSPAESARFFRLRYPAY